MNKIIISARDGSQIPAIVHEPEGGKSPKSNVILAHGLYQSKDEDGRFFRLATFLAKNGFRIIRFDFRGHGENSIHSQDMSIAGLIVDYKSVVEFVKRQFGEPIDAVGSSFGGSTMLLYLQIEDNIPLQRIVLLNPVTDYVTTFIKPWGNQILEMLTPEFWKAMKKNGSASVEDGQFTWSEAAIFEMKLFKPYRAFYNLSIPTRVIHGTKDTAVPYEVTITYATRSPMVDFKSIEGADHAFVPQEFEEETFRLIHEWLEQR